VPLCSSAGSADADGWVAASAVDATQTVQTWTFAVDGGADPGQAIVDRGAYAYLLQIREDQSQTTTSKFPYVLTVGEAVRCASAGDAVNLASPGSPVIVDGVNVTAGDFVLLKDQADATENGIYVAQGPGVPWLQQWRVDWVFMGIPQGYVIPVTSGTVNGSSYWQYQGPDRSTQSISQANAPFANTWGTTTDDPIAEAVGSFAPQGNVYTAALVKHVEIATLEWQ